MKTLVILNPTANRGRAKHLADRIPYYLRQQGCQVKLVSTDSPRQVNQLIQSTAAQRLVVAGGDGTINSVLSAVAGSEIPLSVIPLGSVNVFAREIGLPFDLQDACQVAARGTIRRIDLGRANGRWFSLMAGLGFDAQVVHAIGPQIKNLLGSFGYVLTGLRLLKQYAPADMTITLDDRQLRARAWVAVVGNAASYAHHWKLTPHASIDDGWLDLCLFADAPVRELVGELASALSGRHLDHPQVSYFRARKVTIQADPRVCMQVDGDAAGFSPAEIEIVPKALSVVVPG